MVEEILVGMIRVIFSIFRFAILARVLLSWVRVDPYHPGVRLLYDGTEPILKPIRDMMPSLGMMDFSPIIVLVLSSFVERLLIYVMKGLF